MPHLTIALLGAPQISVDDESIQVDTRKAIALLAYLAVTGHRHRRDALTLLLWPDLDQSKARAALRRTLSALNQTPVANWIEADRENIELRVDEGVTCDVWTFKQIMAQGTEQFELRALEEAVALYRDDFMAGFGLRDAVNFDDWQYFEGEAYRNAYATLLDHFVEHLCEEGDFARAILHARRRLQLDPLHEPSHRTLMRLYAWSDQRTAALRQYRSCVTTLEEELGVPPLAETTALYDQIVNDETLLPPTRSSPGPDTRASEGAVGDAPCAAGRNVPPRWARQRLAATGRGLCDGADAGLLGRGGRRSRHRQDASAQQLLGCAGRD